MSAAIMTIVSGFVLLGVFALVAWRCRRRKGRTAKKDRPAR